MNLKVYYSGNVDLELDQALEKCLSQFGFKRWASGCNIITGERDLAFDNNKKQQDKEIARHGNTSY
jgi:hypothetical protein